MTNWQFFTSIVKAYKPCFRKPKIVILEKRNEYLEKYPDAWAYYDGTNRIAYILKEQNSLAVRLHERGHWVNACIYFMLEIALGFLWWGLGVRSIFKKRGITKRIRS